MGNRPMHFFEACCACGGGIKVGGDHGGEHGGEQILVGTKTQQDTCGYDTKTHKVPASAASKALKQDSICGWKEEVSPLLVYTYADKLNPEKFFWIFLALTGSFLCVVCAIISFCSGGLLVYALGGTHRGGVAKSVGGGEQYELAGLRVNEV